jgi:hypothetical protein
MQRTGRNTCLFSNNIQTLTYDLSSKIPTSPSRKEAQPPTQISVRVEVGSPSILSKQSGSSATRETKHDPDACFLQNGWKLEWVDSLVDAGFRRPFLEETCWDFPNPSLGARTLCMKIIDRYYCQHTHLELQNRHGIFSLLVDMGMSREKAITIRSWYYKYGWLHFPIDVGLRYTLEGIMMSDTKDDNLLDSASEGSTCSSCSCTSCGCDNPD